MKGDCLIRMNEMEPQSVDLILADLPYGSTAARWDVRIPLPALWQGYKRLLKPNGMIALFAQEPFGAGLIQSNLLWFRYEWIWDKHFAAGHGHAKRMPMRRHEKILVFYPGQACYRPELVAVHRSRRAKKASETYRLGYEGAHVQKLTGYPTSILHFRRDPGSVPAQKPIGLLEYLIKLYTHPGGTVLDNCMGTGSAGVAAVRAGREFVGIELDEDRFDVARRRIGEAVSQ